MIGCRVYVELFIGCFDVGFEVKDICGFKSFSFV